LVESDATGAMEYMQIGLAAPACGHLTASSGGKTLCGDYINSRPVRRILAPLQPLIASKRTEPVELRILGR